MSVHRTATGKYLDINALKIQQERTIAVGNARQNARGDLLGPGGQVVKTRDEIMTEIYKAQQGQRLTDNPVYANSDEASAAAIADIFSEPISNGFDQIEQAQENAPQVTPSTPNSSNGGYADALLRSQELAEKLRNQRNRI